MLRQLIVAHLAIVNEGSLTPERAYAIEDITLAQAFYGRLAVGTADYYRFSVAEETTPNFSILVPVRYYMSGFRPLITIRGPGLPAQGLMIPASDEGMRFGTTVYRRTQRTNPTLEAGDYLVELRGYHTTGVYCFCCGSREPGEYADEETMARVKALLED